MEGLLKISGRNFFHGVFLFFKLEFYMKLSFKKNMLSFGKYVYLMSAVGFCSLLVNCKARDFNSGKMSVKNASESVSSSGSFIQEFSLTKKLSDGESLQTRLEMRRIDKNGSPVVDFSSDYATTNAHEVVHTIATTLFEAHGGLSTSQTSIPNEMRLVTRICG